MNPPLHWRTRARRSQRFTGLKAFVGTLLFALLIAAIAVAAGFLCALGEALAHRWF